MSIAPGVTFGGIALIAGKRQIEYDQIDHVSLYTTARLLNAV
jgi:hypothetical protein